MDNDVEIMVNGFEERVPNNATIAFLLHHFGEDDPHVLVEFNGRFVHPQDYDKVTVSNGDRVEFMNPAFGG